MKAQVKIIEVRAIRDTNAIRWLFTGFEFPAGLTDFGRELYSTHKERRLYVEGTGGDKMPCRAASDFCQDHGYEIKYIGFKL